MTHPSLSDIKVGHELPTLTLPPVNRTTLALFAGGSGDHNPIHIDLDFARKSGLPDVFAQGMLGMAWLARLLTAWAPQQRLRRFDVRFQGLMQLGHVLSCHGTVVEIVTHGDERCARIALSSRTQYGDLKIVGDALVALD